MNNIVSTENRPTADLWVAVAPQTTAEQKALFNALSGSSNKLNTVIGTPLSLSNIIIQDREFVNKETGELEKAVRVVLITEDGDVYHSYSKGLHNSVVSFLTSFGTPDTWVEPLKVVVRTVPMSNGGNTYRLEVI